MTASASQCPDPPDSMKYVFMKDTWAEASMNGSALVKCDYLGAHWTKKIGRGYAYTTVKCPTFSFVHRDIGLITRLERNNDYHSDTYREKWYVIDKNENKWTIWESDLYLFGLSSK